MQKTKKSDKASYEQLGQMMVSIYESGYIDKNKSYKMSFVKGVLSGLGGVIGATIVVALLLWMLTLLHHVPFVNRLSDNARRDIQRSTSTPTKK